MWLIPLFLSLRQFKQATRVTKFRRWRLSWLYGFIHELKPLDRQLMLLYLEDTDMQSIAEITGLTSGAVRTQIHRIKKILTRRFHGGGSQ